MYLTWRRALSGFLHWASSLWFANRAGDRRVTAVIRRASVTAATAPRDSAHAVNAAIRRAGLEGRRKTNPVVDGQLVPRARKASGHGEHSLRKRRREEAAAAAPSTRPRN